ncbi:MAG: hypothetical protein IJL69_06705, partial [Oscillospiraceae bacterium]|nr:hypothetical protein [Oscillospiraceae bacterium]
LAVQNFASGAKLTWNAVDGASKYLVFRAEGDGSFEQIASTANTAYVDKSAASGTTYRYRVKAKDALFTSPYSAAIKNTFLAAPKLTATAYSVNIKLTWSEVPGATRYNIFRKVSGGDWESVGYSRTTYYVDKNAEPGVVYYYRADAQVSSYHSAYSAAVSNVLISAPTGLAVQNFASGAKLTWNAVDGASKYLVFRAEGDGAFEQIASTANTAYVDKSAASGTTYRYRVATKISSFTGPFSSIVKNIFLSVPVLSSSSDSVSIRLAWNMVPGATRYNISRRTAGGEWEVIGYSRTTSFVIDKDAESSVIYYYRVDAQVSSYHSAYSSTVN